MILHVYPSTCTVVQRHLLRVQYVSTKIRGTFFTLQMYFAIYMKDPEDTIVSDSDNNDQFKNVTYLPNY